ncbi:PIN domain-containing protein [soil metagenome]
MNKIYLDTCIIIYFIEKHPAYAVKIELLLKNLKATDSLCLSPLTRMECLVMPLRTNDSALRSLYESFFNSQKMLEMPIEVFDNAARLRADFGNLKTPDALHLATALHHNCDEFWTNDNRLNSVAPQLVKNILIT